MKFLFSAMLAMASIAFFACNNETDKTTTTTDSSALDRDTMPPAGDSLAPMPMVAHAEAVVTGTSPDTVVNGTVKFDTVGNKVKMTLELTVPSKAGKQVAVHIHEHGDCGDRGNLAHGHWNPTGAQHGKWGSASYHAGDIGNVKLDNKGKGTLTLESDLWALGGAANKSIIGKAIIVHGGVDDFTTQPTGNAGSRIGCGVIR